MRDPVHFHDVLHVREVLGKVDEVPRAAGEAQDAKEDGEGEEDYLKSSVQRWEIRTGEFGLRAYPRYQHAPVVNAYSRDAKPRAKSHCDENKRNRTSSNVGCSELRSSVDIGVLKLHCEPLTS